MNDLGILMWLVSDIPAMVWVARLVRRCHSPNSWRLIGETKAERARRLRMYRM